MGKLEKRDTKGKITTAALALFSEKGYENTTIEDILEASGTSRGTFYHYFEGKDALFSHMTIVLDEEYRKLAETIPEELDAFEKLMYIDREMFRIIENRISVDLLTRLYSTQLVTRGEKKIFDRNRYFYRLVRQIVEEGQRNGELRDDFTVNEIVKDFSLLERGILYDWCACDGEYGLTSYVTQKMPILFAGYRAK
ncbi:MAG: TetR/AcrR family transcriptional regulator [Mogibacterium sp.]|nr:TetR/AcrR family transcriptional regulator [Mogibacterium sp.]